MSMDTDEFYHVHELEHAKRLENAKLEHAERLENAKLCRLLDGLLACWLDGLMA